MSFRVGEMVKWQKNPNGSLPHFASEVGKGPFKILSIRGTCICDCGQSQRVSEDLNPDAYDDINDHSLDCSLWHSGDPNYHQNYSLLTIQTENGPREFGECWLQKAA